MEDRREHKRPMRQLQYFTPSVTGMTKIEGGGKNQSKQRNIVAIDQNTPNYGGPIPDPRSSENINKKNKVKTQIFKFCKTKDREI